MTQKNRDLLVRELCARLPYQVVCIDTNINVVGTLSQIGVHYDICTLDIDKGDSESCYIPNCKPYLFPLSSMTNEQYDEMSDILHTICHSGYAHHFAHKLIDWYNKNHFDYRELIKDGLAIDATGLNIY